MDGVMVDVFLSLAFCRISGNLIPLPVCPRYNTPYAATFCDLLVSQVIHSPFYLL